MADWTPDDKFRFDLAFALKKVAIRGVRRYLVEQERDRIARAIFDHLRLCGWCWSQPYRSSESGVMAARPRQDDEAAG
jgi:hypothetical protein